MIQSDQPYNLPKEPDHEREEILSASVFPGIDRHQHRSLCRTFLSRDRRGHEAVGRWFHQADQDDHRTGHFLYRGERHRRHGGYEEGRPGRCQGAALLRDRFESGPGHRLAGGQRHPAGCRYERRRQQAGHQGADDLHHPGQEPQHGRFCHEHHSFQRGGCLCQGGYPAGAALCAAVRFCALPARRARQGGLEVCR